MKRLIVFGVILLGLTGCNSGHLTNTCIKEERAGSLKTTTTYTIGFKNDVIDAIDITYDYQDSNDNTIQALQLSTETLNQNLKPTVEVLVDENNHYQVVYHITNDSKEEVKEYFQVQEKRSKLVKDLKEQNFTCK